MLIVNENLRHREKKVSGTALCLGFGVVYKLKQCYKEVRLTLHHTFTWVIWYVKPFLII